MTVTLGIDIGGSKLLVRTLGPEGPTPESDAATPVADARPGATYRSLVETGRGSHPGDIIALAVRQAEQAQRDGLDFAAVGVGFPGLVDFKSGVVRSSVMLDGWRDVPLAQVLGKALGVPVVVDNDVNMAALGELSVRSEPSDVMLMVAVGTGVGGAIALSGEVFRGARGLAGEIGNTVVKSGGPRCWCGRRGCLNVLASGDALCGASRPRSAAIALGKGLANAMNLLDPDLVVLGGGVIAHQPEYFALARDVARREAFAEIGTTVRIEAARLGYDAGAIGAAVLAQEHLAATSQ